MPRVGVGAVAMAQDPQGVKGGQPGAGDQLEWGLGILLAVTLPDITAFDHRQDVDPCEEVLVEQR